jgi:hypothetical protein
MTRSHASWPCFSKANARGWVPLARPVDLVIPSSAIFNFWKTLKLTAHWLCRAKHAGQKTNYRRTEEMVRQIIRHRFLDPDASAEVIAQKLQQARHLISIRSVERVISDFGLQKKTLRLSP